MADLSMSNANDVREHERKLAAAQAAKTILEAATDDSGLHYEFVFPQVRSCEGHKPTPETRLRGSGPYRKALREACTEYKKLHGLRTIEAECIVWVDFPNHYRIMLPGSYSEVASKKKK